ncbi:hypothetical protein [Pendulispora albinea]|uniref:Tetratricopeptide repeat protein n=1 Tax=Pendulispora albinea TaxID=2741071 RepID=A0ABZ2LRC7_9BACT
MATIGCGSLRGRADSAFEKGDYEGAARDYAQVVAQDPTDQEARAKLAQAREKIFLGLLAEVAESKRTGDKERVFSALGRLLDRARGWNDPGSPAIQKRTHDEVAWAEEQIGIECGALLARHAPLLAEDQLEARDRQVLRHFPGSTVKSVITDTIHEYAETQCKRLAPANPAASPYFADLVGKYCAHFHVTTARVPVLPYHVSRVVLAGQVDGLSLEGRDAFATAVQKGLERSSFWDPRAEAPAIVTVSGKNHAAFSSRKMTLSRPWVERIPYQAMEEYQESYTEYYPDTETYYDTEHYTEFETYTHSCGDGKNTCTDTRPVSKTRQVPRTRQVTKSRTAYRTKTRPVTRYREEDRVFAFEATERSGNYEVDVAAHIDFKQGVAPFAVHLSNTKSDSGIDHDSSFPPAGVSPSRSNLQTRDAFWLEQLPTITQRTTLSAHSHWVALFCSQSTYSSDEAARCYYVPAAERPKAARDVLFGSFGPDIDNVQRL